MDIVHPTVSSSRKFICRFPNCNARYQRKEHLSRHQAQHLQPQSFRCSICSRTFGRNDTLRRHMRRAHAVDEPAPPTRRACSHCRDMKSRCEGGPPCGECLRRRIPCSLNELGRRDSAERLPRSEIRKDRFFVDLYFERFHPYWPFIHRGSFNQDHETSLLVQSMMAIGLWASGEQRARSAAIDLHDVLGSAIRQQRDVWDASAAENAGAACAWPIPTYQAILLHIIFALMHRGGGTLGLDLKPSLPPADNELLGSLVASCKRLGMLYYPNMLARYLPDDLVSFVWTSVEEVKRFNLSLYKLYRMVSRPGKDCGVTEATRRGVTANDLQFPLPKNDPLWNAVTKDEWSSAWPEDLNRCSLDIAMEDEWISNSAEFVGLIG